MLPEHFLSQRNIYIFPSAQGFAFSLMLGLMLVTAINYQSSLIYLLVFILGSIFLVSIWLCFFNMQGLKLRITEMHPVQAGEGWRLTLHADSGGKERSGFYARFETSEEDAVWPLEKSPNVVLRGSPHARGVYPLPGVRIATFFPFGLIRAWTWLWFDTPLIVYPRPEKPPEAASSKVSLESERPVKQGDDLGEVRSYQEGDQLNRILWRHYARREELVIRSPELIGSQKATLDWESYSSFGVEQALSFMAYDVLKLYEDNVEFEMSLPGVEIPMNSGDQHRDKCLEALARY